MLSLLSKDNKNHIRSSPEAQKLKKTFQKLFKEKDLGIIVQCNLKITNYLDIQTLKR